MSQKNPEYEKCAKCGMSLPDEADRSDVRFIRHERRIKRRPYRSYAPYEILSSHITSRFVLCYSCRMRAEDQFKGWIKGETE